MSQFVHRHRLPPAARAAAVNRDSDASSASLTARPAPIETLAPTQSYDYDQAFGYDLSSIAIFASSEIQSPTASISGSRAAIQRQFDDGADLGHITTPIGPQGGMVDDDIQERIERSRGGGVPVDRSARTALETAFNYDFGRVRVFDDSESDRLSRALGAMAFTSSSDIFFRSGAYEPQSRDGRLLLGHELMHVMQQQVAPSSGPMVVTPSDGAAERDADTLARQALSVEYGGSRNDQQSYVRSEPQLVQGIANSGPVVQRYQAGDTGHGGIEQRALTSSAVGMSDDQASQVYFGNWLRDLSQLPPAALPLINILALGEFGREVTQKDLGTYVPSEHLDNPEGGGTIEDPRIQMLANASDPAKRAQFEAALAKLSPAQRKAYDDEQARLGEIQSAAARSGLPVYIERGKLHAKTTLEDAIKARSTSTGRRLMGDALHAVEDYFSHSNFTEAAIWTANKEGLPVQKLVDRMGKTTLGASAALAGGLDPDGRPKIVTGTYAPGANDWVSRFELLKTEIEHGQLTKAFVIGWLRLNGIRGEEIGRRLGGGALGAAGSGVGLVAGGVSGAGHGLMEGAERGWEQSSGWRALRDAASGAVSGLVEGADSGAEAGYQEGGDVGESAGSFIGGKLGYGAGVLVGTAEEVVAAAGVAAVMKAFPEIGAMMAALIVAAETDVVAEHETQASADQAKAAGLSGPTHSQIAKDAPDNPLFSVSVRLAETADEAIGSAMQRAWTELGESDGSEPTAEQLKQVTDLVDKYVSTPEHDPWWKPIVVAATLL